MALEATVVCMDNSEWTRNGDFSPSRFQAQADAINLLAGAKTQANAENTVGLLTTAGKSPRVLVTPTPDLGKILNALHGLDMEGEANVASAVQIAQLALKHRQDKHHRQRIVLFVCSPLRETKDVLVKIAKKLKKNNVAVDVVSLGCEENTAKLEAFRDTINSGDNSHFVAIPVGAIPSDALFNTPIYQVEGGSGYGGGDGGAGAAEGGGGFDFGVDPSLDPELALALRVSVEEERARQQQQQAAAAAAGEGQAAGSSSGAAAGGSAAPAGAQQAQQAERAGGPQQGGAAAAAASAADAMTEDELLQQALAMSMEVDEPPAAAAGAALTTPAPPPAATPAVPQSPVKAPPPGGAPGGSHAPALQEDMDDEELQAALQMSMLETEAGPPAAATEEREAIPEDPTRTGQPPTRAELQEFIASLGEDINMEDPELQAELAKFRGGPQGDGEGKGGSGKKGGDGGSSGDGKGKQ